MDKHFQRHSTFWVACCATSAVMKRTRNWDKSPFFGVWDEGIADFFPFFQASQNMSTPSSESASVQPGDLGTRAMAGGWRSVGIRLFLEGPLRDNFTLSELLLDRPTGAKTGGLARRVASLGIFS